MQSPEEPNKVDGQPDDKGRMQSPEEPDKVDGQADDKGRDAIAGGA